jgi:hypothetical protein
VTAELHFLDNVRVEATPSEGGSQIQEGGSE